MGLNVIYTQTITLFNRHYETANGVEKLYWYPTVIPSVHLVANRAKIISMYGELCQDNVLLHIRYSPSGADAAIEGKTYIKPLVYAATQDVSSYITFNMGDNFDFFIEGEWDGEDRIDDDAYQSGFFDYMNHNSDHAWVVTNCTQYFLLPHFELTGR
jgi:hypothetical protein